MLSNKQRRLLFEILPFGIIPAIFSAVHVLLEKGILGNHPIYPSTGNPYDSNIVISVLTSLAIGFAIGFLEALYINTWFMNKKFYQKIIFKSLIYILAIVLASLIIIVLGHSLSQGLSPFSSTVWRFVSSFFANIAFWSIICYYSLAIIICLFYKEFSDHIGQAVSFNFFTGKYHRPRSENRVFMFLDMKDSTTHAEKLGHIKYFEMLKEYYEDISRPILTYGGEIYQYVGDEIVITWNAKKDFTKNALDCFFAMRDELSNQHQKYHSRYGVAPKFKAGIHYGKVTTGEIGLLKRDIVFTGDTLNTTARIQSLCNGYNVDLLVSDIFFEAYDPGNKYHFESLGKIELKGRDKKVELFKVQ